MNTAVLLADAEFRVVYSNRYSDEVTPAKLLGKPVWECVEMTPESSQAIRETLEAVSSDRQPRVYEMDGPGIGHWQTVVHYCGLPIARYLLDSRQMPPELTRLSRAQRDFCRLALDADSKALARLLGCSLQTVSYRRAAVARALSIAPTDLRCHLAQYRRWLE